MKKATVLIFLLSFAVCALMVSLGEIYVLRKDHDRAQHDAYVKGLTVQMALISAGEVNSLTALFNSTHLDGLSEVDKARLRGLLTSNLVSAAQTFHSLKGGMEWEYAYNFGENEYIAMAKQLEVSAADIKRKGKEWGLTPEDISWGDRLSVESSR